MARSMESPPQVRAGLARAQRKYHHQLPLTSSTKPRLPGHDEKTASNANPRPRVVCEEGVGMTDISAAGASDLMAIMEASARERKRRRLARAVDAELQAESVAQRMDAQMETSELKSTCPSPASSTATATASTCRPMSSTTTTSSLEETARRLVAGDWDATDPQAQHAFKYLLEVFFQHCQREQRNGLLPTMDPLMVQIFRLCRRQAEQVEEEGPAQSATAAAGSGTTGASASTAPGPIAHSQAPATAPSAQYGSPTIVLNLPDRMTGPKTITIGRGLRNEQGTSPPPPVAVATQAVESDSLSRNTSDTTTTANGACTRHSHDDAATVSTASASAHSMPDSQRPHRTSSSTPSSTSPLSPSPAPVHLRTKVTPSDLVRAYKLLQLEFDKWTPANPDPLTTQPRRTLPDGRVEYCGKSRYHYVELCVGIDRNAVSGNYARRASYVRDSVEKFWKRTTNWIAAGCPSGALVFDFQRRIRFSWTLMLQEIMAIPEVRQMGDQVGRKCGLAEAAAASLVRRFIRVLEMLIQELERIDREVEEDEEEEEEE